MSTLVVSKQEYITKYFSDLSEFIAEYLLSKGSKSTRENYARSLRDFFAWAKTLETTGQKITHPSQVKRVHVLAYREFLVKDNQAPKTIGVKLSAIRDFFQFCLDKGVISEDPSYKVKTKLKMAAQSKPDAMTDEEAAKVINSPDTSTLEGARDRITLVLLFNLGLRATESCHLKVRNFQAVNGTIVCKITGKGSKTRSTPLTPFILEELKKYTDAWTLHTGTTLDLDDYLIQTQFRQVKVKNTAPTTRFWVNDLVQKYTKQAGVEGKKISSHSCRTTAINTLLDAGETTRNVANFAGHASVLSTEEYERNLNNLTGNSGLRLGFGNTKG